MPTSGPGTRKKRPRHTRLETFALFKEVTERMFLPDEVIHRTVYTFLDVIAEALLEEKKVVIRNFGTFRIKRAIGGKGPSITVKFNVASDLKIILRDRLMDKYGVVMNNEAVMLAKLTGKCPVCKQQLETTDPPLCPTCGTKPFEAKAAETSSISYYKKPTPEDT